ncbi:MAG: hypothetical protein JWQ02_1209 [Capsulimonas sp.]|nr:hypothetical protein [Capsulimonas sp.]
MMDEQQSDLQAENARMAVMLERYAGALEAIGDAQSLEDCRALAAEALTETAAHSHVIPDDARPPHSEYVAKALDALEELDA